MKPLIVIQARMGSTRFPGKVLAPLCGKPVIRRVVEACERSGYQTVVTIPVSDCGGPLPAYLALMGQRWHTAMVDEDDVLGRYAACAREHPEVTHVVRITADCPLVDHRTIQLVVQQTFENDCVYLGACNAPDGNDVEVFPIDFLREAEAETPPAAREHVVNWYVKKRRLVCELGGYNDVKYSVDTPDDLAVCAALLRRVGNGAEWQSYVDCYRTWIGKPAIAASAP